MYNQIRLYIDICTAQICTHDVWTNGRLVVENRGTRCDVCTFIMLWALSTYQMVNSQLIIIKQIHGVSISNFLAFRRTISVIPKLRCSVASCEAFLTSTLLSASRMPTKYATNKTNATIWSSYGDTADNVI